MGVGVGVKDGRLLTIVGSSEPGTYLRPGVTRLEGELLATGLGDAEAKIVAYARALQIQLLHVGAGRPICPECVKAISEAGARPATACTVQPCSSKPSAIVVPARPGPIRVTVRGRSMGGPMLPP